MCHFYLLCLFQRQCEREEIEERSFLLLFSLQMAAAARAGAGLEPGTPAGSLTWTKGA